MHWSVFLGAFFGGMTGGAIGSYVTALLWRRRYDWRFRDLQNDLLLNELDRLARES